MPFLAPLNESPNMRYPGSALLLVALCVRRATSQYDERLCNDGSYTSSGTDLECKTLGPDPDHRSPRPRADLLLTVDVPNAWNPDEKGFSCISVSDRPRGPPPGALTAHAC